MKKQFCILIFSILFISIWAGSGFANAKFSVAPGMLHFDLTQSRLNDSVIVKNESNGPIRIKLTPVFYPLDSEVLAAGSPIDPANPPDDDISDLIVVSPKIASLQPGAKRTVRIAIRKNRVFESGDYRAHVLIKALDAPAKSKKSSIDSNNRAGNFKMVINFNIQTAIAIYGHMGQGKSQLELKLASSSDSSFGIAVTNPDKYRYDGWLSVYDFNNPETPLVTKRLISLRESIQILNFKLPPPRKILLKWGSNKNMPDDGQLTIPGIQ